MRLYAGIDLHSNNNHLAIIDEEDRRIYQKRLPNMVDVILSEIEPYRNHETCYGVLLGTGMEPKIFWVC